MEIQNSFTKSLKSLILTCLILTWLLQLIENTDVFKMYKFYNYEGTLIC